LFIAKIILIKQPHQGAGMRFTTLLFLLSFSFGIYSADQAKSADDENYGNVVVSEVTSIYDGDTFRCTIKDWPRIIGYRIPVRVAGIDCPELKDNRPEIKELTRKAKQHTVQRL